MNLIDEIFKQLNAGKAKDSPEILALLATVQGTDNAHFAIAQSIVNNWPTPQPRQNWSDRLPSRNALWNGGMGAAGLVSVPWVQPFLLWLQQNLTLPVVHSPVILFFVIAGLGALAGAACSIYQNRGIVLPALGEQKGVLTLTRFGIVNEISYGALAAVTTIWLAAVGLAPVAGGPQAPSTATSPAAAAAPANHLTYSVLLGAIVAGWFGARMRSSRLDQALLKEALSKTAVREKQESGLEQLIVNAPSAAAAATLATGMEVVGAMRSSPSPPIAPTP